MVTVLKPADMGAPVVFDSPHSGRLYPDDFEAAAEIAMLRHYEDRFVDELLVDAPERGIALVAAEFARAYVDPNRTSLDIDRALLDGDWPGEIAPTRHAERGLGLIFRILTDSTPIYDRHLTPAEIERRIETCWLPYHKALDTALDTLQGAGGEVWHVNWHSMKPVGDSLSPDPGAHRADFVLGDRHGESCEERFTAFVAETLERMGHSVAINEPYSGAYIVERHGRPGEGRHSLQIEINRALYMDVATLKKSHGFDALREDLARVADAIADYARERRGA